MTLLHSKLFDQRLVSKILSLVFLLATFPPSDTSFIPASNNFRSYQRHIPYTFCYHHKVPSIRNIIHGKDVTNTKNHNVNKQSRRKAFSLSLAPSSQFLHDVVNINNLDKNIEDTVKNIDSFFESKNENGAITRIKETLQRKIQESHSEDLKFCSSFPTESVKGNNERIVVVPTYEQIEIAREKAKDHDVHHSHNISKPSFLAIRTNDEENPILDQKSISTIINAAESVWFGNKNNRNDSEGAEEQKFDSETKSRFTYQRKGNYEAHLVDLANSIDENIHTIINEALTDRVYPMVRDAFQNDIPDIQDIEFCVYDSLIIRYNATEALMSEKGSSDSSNERSIDYSNDMVVGAGQPLHRDLGIVSVNIMLNSDDNFMGGGTFFEEQMRPSIIDSLDIKTKGVLLQEEIEPLKPSGIGQALAHLSSMRHAGAGTKSGVRDILVMFLSAKRKDSNVPIMDEAARLKFNARKYAQEYQNEEGMSTLHRMVSYKLAIDNTPGDGEAWHYMGMALREYSLNKELGREESKALAEMAISCLKIALTLTPCDGRLCNNLGLAHETLFSLDASKKYDIENNEDFIVHSDQEQEIIANFYSLSLKLHGISKKVGCDVSFDFDQACLNYGLYLSKQNRFSDAAEILSYFNDVGTINGSISDENHLRMIFDGTRLFQFCKNK